MPGLIVAGVSAIIFLLAGGYEGNAQLLNDSVAVNLVKKGIGRIYNFQFRLAEDVLKKIDSKYPGHPVTYVYKGMMIYYQNYPLTPETLKSKSFESQLWTSIKLSESEDGWENDPENLLIDLCARGLLMLFYTENNMNREVITMTPSTYKCLMRSFRFDSLYPDFKCFTGLYNYYREAYPEHHPVYKTIAFLFPSGDKKKGLKELNYAAKNAMVMQAEAVSMLSWISIHYENDFIKALNYSKTIYDSYPANLYFKGEYLKNLFLLRKYDEAEALIHSWSGENNPYFKGQLFIFSALLQEKKYHNYDQAEKFYKEGLSYLRGFKARGMEFSVYGNKGLERIKDLRDGRQADKKKKDNGSDEIDLG